MTNPEKQPEQAGESEKKVQKPASEPVAEKESKEHEKEASALVQLAEEIDVPPPAIQKMFEMGFAAMGGSMQRYHPIFDKFKDEHVTRFIDYLQTDDNHDYQLQNTNRYFYLVYAFLGLGFLVFLIVFLLPQNEDLLIDILKIIVSFAGGFGGGFGLKAYLDRKKQS